MFKIEVDGQNYVQPIRKFSVSKDLMYAALVKHDDTILVYKLLERDGQKLGFMTENQFKKETRPFRKIAKYPDIIDLFIFKNTEVA